ncbi:hypothetical protein TSUD_121130 [Trifolium subterraneum]|nr:hypothetical protein TSUD_121130 [Trifolium subterraneum]
MDTIYLGWFGLVIGFVLWWWNEYWYVVPLKFKCSKSATKLPPGHMGFPIIGEMISFLWYFKIVRRPDDFINAKRRKYGDGDGMFRTHLFGVPSIIVYNASVHKYVLHTEDIFKAEWPTIELMGRTSMVAVHGKAHTRVRSFVTNAINRPEALNRIAAHVQPRMVIALRSWAQTGKINARLETQKLTFDNIGKLFMSMEPGPLLQSMDKLYQALLLGVRAYPINIPGFAYHRALQEENMALRKERPEDFITPKDVSNLKYTNKVVEEVIRMANVAACAFRKSDTEVNYKGYKIPKGWNVILMLRYLHTNSENFKDPMCFNPDRWDEPAKAGSYQPFGGGQRLCPGNTLARIQLALLLHHLSIGYKWELINPNANIGYLSHPAPIDGVEVKFDTL